LLVLASPLLLGLLLGIRHAGDADHVATIATVVVGRTHLLGAIRTAILWGLGHSLTFFAVGLAIVVFGLHVPAQFETGVDLAIAVSLLVLGGIQLVRARHNQLIQHDPHASRPLLLGSLHGLAGSAGVALLALAAIQTKHEALLYLVLFALGTMTGMAGITFLLAWSFRISSSLAWVRRSLVLAAGVVSCTCGLSILLELAA
jgi:nickel/cobalt transporter (NicO) family protein